MQTNQKKPNNLFNPGRFEELCRRFDHLLIIRENKEITERKSDRLPRQVSLKMENLLEEFAVSFFRAGKSPITIKNYLKNLGQFVKENGILRIGDITKESIQNWMTILRTKDCGDGFIANHLWALKAFLAFAMNDKGIPCYEWDIRIPKVFPSESVEFLEKEELELLFSLLDNANTHDIRLRAFIELMVGTGMRPSEALNLKREDLASRPNEIEIIGKGKKKRTVYFTERVYCWLDLYLAQRKDNHPALFVTHNGKEEARALTLRSAEYAFQQLINKSGLNGNKRKITPHTLRHTFATLLMVNGCIPEFIVPLLGHSSIKTTRKYYLAVRQKHAKAAFYQFNPFGNSSSFDAAQKPPAQLTAALN